MVIGLVASLPATAQNRLAAAGITAASVPQGDPALECEAAIAAAQNRYGLPPGILRAIGVVESGRTDARSGISRPWPWTIQAAGQSLYFPTKAQAVAWASEAQGRGLSLIDAGCLQVNLFFHPTAFASLSAAFDPASNADYAARFLVALRSGAADWPTAIGYYHSRTPELAAPYQRSVQRLLAGPPLPAAIQVTALSRLAHAWQATLPMTPPDAQAQHGNSWDTLLGRQALQTHPGPGRNRLYEAAGRPRAVLYAQASHGLSAAQFTPLFKQERGS